MTGYTLPDKLECNGGLKEYIIMKITLTNIYPFPVSVSFDNEPDWNINPGDSVTMNVIDTDLPGFEMKMSGPQIKTKNIERPSDR